MSWRWISVTALLAAVVVSYGVFLGQGDDAGFAPAVERPQPGYYLKDAIITDTTEAGTPELRLAARRIEQQPADNSIALEDVEVDYLAIPERHWRLTANEGTVPGGSATIRFSGDVRLEAQHQPHGAVILTNTLTIDTETSVASTDAPVSIEMSGHRVTAHGMVADLESNHVQLESNVHGRFTPQ